MPAEPSTAPHRAAEVQTNPLDAQITATPKGVTPITASTPESASAAMSHSKGLTTVATNLFSKTPSIFFINVSMLSF